MVVLPHTVIALLVARTLPNQPLVTGSAGALSHFLADRIPHTDYEPFTKTGLPMLGIDCLLAGAVVKRYARNDAERVGAIAGAAVDGWVATERATDKLLLELVHRWNHAKTEPRLGYGILQQVAIVIAGVLYLERARRQQQALAEELGYE
jgi:hypothetical protein